MTKYVNITPHQVTIWRDGKIIAELVESGIVARVTTDQSRIIKQIPELGGITMLASEYGPIVGLPDPVPGTIYVASSLVGMAAAHIRSRLAVRKLKGEILTAAEEIMLNRDDIVCPDTGPSCVKNEHDKVVGVTRFQVWS